MEYFGKSEELKMLCSSLHVVHFRRGLGSGGRVVWFVGLGLAVVVARVVVSANGAAAAQDRVSWGRTVSPGAGPCLLGQDRVS